VAIVKSGSASDLWTVDTSKAGRLVSYDVLGSVRGPKQTYGGASAMGVPVSTPFFLINGSDAKTITLQTLSFTGIVGSAVGYAFVTLTRYRTPFTGGTPGYISTAPYDSTGGLKPVGLGQAYSSQPTVGLSIGIFGTLACIVQSSAATATAITQGVAWDFRNEGEAGGIVLRGLNQCVAAVVNAAQSVTANVEARWIEE